MYDIARMRTSIDTVSYDMHVDYRHDHGFTEIANMSGTIVRDSVKIRQLLYNLGDKKLSLQKSVRVGENMIHAIDQAGFDSTLWAANNIVKRTQVEERIAFRDSSFWSSRKSGYETPPTAQDQYLQNAIQQLMSGTMQLQRTRPAPTGPVKPIATSRKRKP